MKIKMKNLLFLLLMAYMTTLLPIVSVCDNENAKLDEIMRSIENDNVSDLLKQKITQMITDIGHTSTEDNDIPQNNALVSFDAFISAITLVTERIPELQGLVEKGSISKNNINIMAYEVSEHYDLVTRSYSLDGEEMIECVLFRVNPNNMRELGLLALLYIETIIRAIEPHLQEADFATKEIGLLLDDVPLSDSASSSYLGKQYDLSMVDSGMWLFFVSAESP